MNKLEEEKDIENEMTLATYTEIPKFMQDNEYIHSGYLLYCDSYKKSFKSLFILTNETVNIWSHLLGAILFIFLLWYTSTQITCYNTQLKILKNKISLIENSSQDLLEKFDKYEAFIEFTQSIKDTYILSDYSKFKNKHKDTNRKLKGAYESLIELINRKNSETSFPIIENMKIKIKNHFIELQESLTILNELGYILFEGGNESEVSQKARFLRHLSRWPLFVYIFSAILCFLFSASFHLLFTISPKHYALFGKFDYGGISLIILGSCFPPYFYYFYFDILYRNLYLIFISIFGLLIFVYSLSNSFYSSSKRTLRGLIFLSFGISTAIPIIHMTIFGHTIKGNESPIELKLWLVSGILSIIGGILYTIRFPEKKYPGQFDFFGSSHQIFHSLVALGIFLHYIQSILAYYYRFKNYYNEKYNYYLKYHS